MAIRFLSSETIDGALTVNSTVTLNKTNNVINIPSLVDNGKFLQVTQVGNETWEFKCESLSGSLDGVTIGTTPGKVAFDENGQIQSIQLLDVATAGGRLTGFSNRGYLSSIHLEQTATNTNGGYIRFLTAASGTTSGLERFKITETGAFSVGPSGTNYGTSGQVLTSQGNALPTWTTPTTGTITGSGTADKVTKFTSATAIGDGPITFATNDSTFAGNVGIGGTLANKKLYVLGDTTNYQILAEQPSGYAGLSIKSTTVAQTWSWLANDNGSNSDLLLYGGAAAGTKLTIDSAGNVGIGTTTPERILHLDADQGRPIIQLDKGGDKIISMGTGSSATGADDTIFQMFNEGSELVRIFTEGNSWFNGGNVGIGTTSPLEKLNIVETTTTAGTFFPVAISGSRYQADYGVGIAFRPENNSTAYSNKTAIVGSGGGYGYNMADLHFCFNNSTTLSDEVSLSDSKVTMKRSGNVGIGTTSPSATEPTGGNLPTGWARAGSRALEIAAPDFANSGLFLRNSDTTATGTDITGDQYYGDTYIDNRFNNDNGSIYFRTKTAATAVYAMAIKGTGNVGIGTTSPEQALHVEGRGIFDGGTSSDILQIRNDNGGGVFGMTSNLFALDLASTSSFRIRQGSSVPFYLKSDGNLGIGTTAPASRIDVREDANNVYTGYFYNSSTAANAHGINVQTATTNAGAYAFRVNSASNTNALVVMGNARVGIGTSTPDMPLDVAGNIRSRVASNVAGGFYIGEGHTAEAFGLLSQGANGYFKIRDEYNNADRFYIENDGNVGIGTTSPTATFQVGGGTANVLQKIWGSGTAGIQIFTNSPSSGTKIAALEQWFSDEGSLQLFYQGTSKVRFRANDASFIAGGSLGIGTTSPSVALDVIGEISASDDINTTGKFFAFAAGAELRLKSTSDTGESYINFADPSDNNVGQIFYGHSDNRMIFRVNDDERMRITSAGDVGIGTTTPGRKLGVNGGATQDGGIQLETTATASNFWSGIEFKTPNATSFMYMSSGDAAGTLKFVPAGSVKASLNATSFICAGDVVAYGSPSDITLKKNIKPLENSLDKIKSLQGVSFTWKKPGLSNIVDDMGFIAQDVKEVVPKLVRENEDGKLSMRHQGVIPILVEAMKEQQKQIDRLEEQIKKMSSKN